MAERGPGTTPGASLLRDRSRLVCEGESLDGTTLISAHGDRRWKVRRVGPGPLRHGFAAGDTVYELTPQGGDVRGFGGVKRLIRSEHELLKSGWRVVT